MSNVEPSGSAPDDPGRSGDHRERGAPGDRPTPWWHEAVVYQIYPRSFADADGDGIGDLQGIIDHLDHVVDLGVDTIWISPFYPSPQEDFGYDIADYCDVDPAYGDLATAEALITAAHDRGLRVLFDMVLNHTSDQHPWFVDSQSARDAERADWYVWADGSGPGGRRPPNNWRSAFVVSSAWQWHEGRGQWFLASFLPCQPDLNWRNPLVKEAMFDACRFWLGRGVDGFRLDMYDSVMKDPQLRSQPLRPRAGRDGITLHDRRHTQHHPDLLDVTRELRQVCREFDEPDDEGRPTRERVLIGEVFGPAEVLRRYLCDGDGLQLVFLFDFLTFSYSADWFRGRLQRYERAFPWPDQPTYVLENHDRSRCIDRVGGDEDRARVLATVLLTARGVPTVYMGQELGLANTYLPLAGALDPVARTYFGWLPEAISRRLPERLNRDEMRTPIPWESGPNGGFCPAGVEPWLPVTDAAVARNVADQRDDPDSMLAWYRALLRVRRDRPELHRGRLDLVPGVPDDVLAYVRSDGRQRLLVAANLGTTATTVALGGEGRVVLGSRPDIEVEGPSVALPPDTAVLVDLDPD